MVGETHLHISPSALALRRDGGVCGGEPSLGEIRSLFSFEKHPGIETMATPDFGVIVGQKTFFANGHITKEADDISGTSK